jgi:hydrogenase maturation protease
VSGDRAPVLVLGLGNLLLQDDAVGLELLARLAAEPQPGAEYVDGGTQGLALAGLLEGRTAALLLDAVRLGAAPGTVHRLDEALRCAPERGGTGHEANAGDLLAAAALVGDLPARVAVVGVEPGSVRTGLGLSDAVLAALPAAAEMARALLAELMRPSGGIRCGITSTP